MGMVRHVFLNIVVLSLTVTLTIIVRGTVFGFVVVVAVGFRVSPDLEIQLQCAFLSKPNNTAVVTGS